MSETATRGQVLCAQGSCLALREEPVLFLLSHQVPGEAKTLPLPQISQSRLAKCVSNLPECQSPLLWNCHFINTEHPLGANSKLGGTLSLKLGRGPLATAL